MLLRLKLQPVDETRVAVSVVESPAGEADAQSSLPFGGRPERWAIVHRLLEATDQTNEDFSADERASLAELGLLADAGSLLPADVAARVGSVLYASLFPPGSDVERALERSRATVAGSGEHLLVELMLPPQSAARVAQYPWELACTADGFLAHREVTFSRYIAHLRPPPAVRSVERLEVLVVASRAADPAQRMPRLSDAENEAIRRGLERSHDAGHIRLEAITPATCEQLRRRLADGVAEHRVPHVLHFDGHGAFGRRCDHCRRFHGGLKAATCANCGASLPAPCGVLVFETEDGGPDYVTADEFGALLQQTALGDVGAREELALVVLSACRSGLATGGESVFNGVAQRLISHGVPAVVAMQYRVTAAAAAAFAEHFYRALAAGEPLGAAVARGREAIGVRGSQWYRPVLFLRWRDNRGGRIFNPVGDVDRGWLETHAARMREALALRVAGAAPDGEERLAHRYVELAAREGEATFPLEAVTQEPGILLLSGEGGAGKTTSLLALGSGAAWRALDERGAPVPLYARLNFFDTDRSGLARLLEMLAGGSGIERDAVERLWRDQRRPLLVLLDGLSEVDRPFAEACQRALVELVQRSAHTFVIASRPGSRLDGLAVQLRGAKRLELLALDDHRIHEYLERSGASAAVQRIGGRLRALSRNPFMLAAIVDSGASESADQPESIGQLYRRLIDDRLFRDRESRKGVAAVKYDYLSVKRTVLAHLAFGMTLDGVTRRTVDLPLLRGIRDDLRALQADYEGVAEVMPASPVAKDFLDEAIGNSVLRQAGNTFEFWHESIQEYFTAVHVAGLAIDEWIQLTPPLRWRQVAPPDLLPVSGAFFMPARMAAGLMESEADELIDALIDHNPWLAAHCLPEAARVSGACRRRARDAWLALLERPRERYRFTACQCLAVAGVRDEVVWRRLLRAILEDDDSWVRWRAIDALAQLDAGDAAAELVEIAVGDPDTSRTEWAKKAIYGLRSDRAVECAFACWRDEPAGSERRRRAESVLAYLKHDGASRWLRRTADEADDATRMAAEDALRSIARWETRDAGPLTASIIRSVYTAVTAARASIQRWEIDELIAALGHEWGGIRHAAMRELGLRAAPAATGPLAAALRSEESPELAVTAAVALSRCLRAAGPLATVPAVLDEPEPPVPLRRAVVLALGGARDAGASLIAALADQEETVREEAALALGIAWPEEAPRPEGAEAALLARLGADECPGPVRAVVGALAALRSPSALEALFAALLDASRRTGWPAPPAAPSGGPSEWPDAIHEALSAAEAIGLLLPRLEAALNAGPAVRLAAAWELARIEGHDESVERLADAALDKPEPEVRVCGLAALRRREVSRGILEGRVSTALADPCESVRSEAGRVLGIAAQRDAGLVGLLEQALAGGDSVARAATLAALNEAGHPPPWVLGSAIAAMNAPEAEVRLQAAALLSRRSEPEAEDALLRAALTDDDPAVRAQAAKGLRRLDSDRFIDDLRDAVDSADSGVAVRAIEALVHIDDESMVSALQAKLKAPSEDVRAAAARTLLTLREAFDDATRAALEIALRGATASARRVASQGLFDADEGEKLVDAVEPWWDAGEYRRIVERVGEWTEAGEGDLSQFDLLVWRAYGLWALEDREAALRTFEDLPFSESYRIQRAWLLLELGRAAEAIEIAHADAASADDDAERQVGAARVVFAARDLVSARMLAERALQVDPSSVDAAAVRALASVGLRDDEPWRAMAAALDGLDAARADEVRAEMLAQLEDLAREGIVDPGSATDLRARLGEAREVPEGAPPDAPDAGD